MNLRKTLLTCAVALAAMSAAAVVQMNNGGGTFAAYAIMLGAAVGAAIGLPAAGAANVGRTLLSCAAVTLAAATIVFVVLPAPFHGDALVLAADAVVLIAGLATMVVVPFAVVRSGWAAVLAVVAVPTFLLSILFSAFYLPYGWSYVRCGGPPVIVSSFMGERWYDLPGGRD